MPRPPCCRRVGCLPRCLMFKPAGIPASRLEVVVLGLDEMEAIRLADLLGLYQEQAAEQMNVSRQTFGRIVEVARRKVAQALIEGKVLRIEHGEVEMSETRRFKCHDCDNTWERAFGAGRPAGCPQCQSTNIHRAITDRGQAGGPNRERGHCHRGSPAARATKSIRQ